MDFNYTLRYRTFDQLLEDVTVDFSTFALENMIEPQQLIKVAKRINYDLGLRLNQQKEILLEVLPKLFSSIAVIYKGKNLFGNLLFYVLLFFMFFVVK